MDEQVMEKNIFLDGNEYEFISDGFYKAKTPYPIKSKRWIFVKQHYNFSVVCRADKNGGLSIIYLADKRTKGNDALYDLFLKMDREGKSVSFIDGIYEDDDNESVDAGGMYV